MVYISVLFPFVRPRQVDGMTAPMVLDGPMNRVAFQVYVEQAQGRRTHHRRPVGRDPRRLSALHAKGLRQLFHRSRV